MSKIGLTARISALFDAAERADPFAARLHRLPPALRMRFELWRNECDRIHEQYEREGGPGASYAAMLDGTLVTPEPSRALAKALGFDSAPVLLETMTLREVADAWAAMIAT